MKLLINLILIILVTVLFKIAMPKIILTVLAIVWVLLLIFFFYNILNK